jgi:hypothetical protein
MHTFNEKINSNSKKIYRYNISLMTIVVNKVTCFKKATNISSKNQGVIYHSEHVNLTAESERFNF